MPAARAMKPAGWSFENPQPFLQFLVVDNEHKRLHTSAFDVDITVLSYVLLSWPNSNFDRHESRHANSHRSCTRLTPRRMKCV